MDKSVLYNMSYGMYIISTKDGDKNVGCVANSVFQITSSPATIAVSLNKDNYTHSCILKSGRFSVSILSESVNENIIGTFGFHSSKDMNKFDKAEFITAEDGIPVLTEGACGYLECRNLQTLDCGTHTIILSEITNAVSLNNSTPMTYAYYHKVIKGKAPKNAPTFIEPSEENQEKYVCSVCGYEYPGTREEFEALDDSYVCPLCMAAKAQFVLQ